MTLVASADILPLNCLGTMAQSADGVSLSSKGLCALVAIVSWKLAMDVQSPGNEKNMQ